MWKGKLRGLVVKGPSMQVDNQHGERNKGKKVQSFIRFFFCLSSSSCSSANLFITFFLPICHRSISPRMIVARRDDATTAVDEVSTVLHCGSTLALYFFCCCCLPLPPFFLSLVISISFAVIVFVWYCYKSGRKLPLVIINFRWRANKRTALRWHCWWKKANTPHMEDTVRLRSKINLSNFSKPLCHGVLACLLLFLKFTQKNHKFQLDS